MSHSSSNSPRHPRPPLSPKGLILLIVLVGIALMIWGLDFGLPQRFHPDEPVVVTRAQYGVATNDWNPEAFHWPSLQIYLLGIEYAVWFWLGSIAGYWRTADPEFIAYAFRAPGGFYYLGRLTTVLFGAGCVWLTYLLARRFLRTPGALAAAALVAVHPIMARHGRYITPDIPAEFFFLAALIYIDRLHASLTASRDPDASEKQVNGRPARLGVIAAVMTGLGAGTKYPVGILALPLVAVALAAPSRLRVGRRLFLALSLVIVVAVVFLLTTPFALLDWGRFQSDIATIGWHVRAGHIGMEAAGGIWLASLHQFVRDSGWAWTALGATGAAILLLANPRRTWPLILAFAMVLLGLAPLKVFSDRYLVPLVPFLALGLGWWLDFIQAQIHRVGQNGEHEGKRRALEAVITCAVLATGIPGVVVLCWDAHKLTLPDTREAALVWVVENIPVHSIIVEDQGGPDLNSPGEGPDSAALLGLVPEPWYYVTEIPPMFFRGGGLPDPLNVLLDRQPNWVITSSRVRHRYMREGAEEEFPDIVAAFRIYYDLIENHLIEEARFSPGEGVVGPEIAVYRVPEGLWRRVAIGEATIEQVLEREQSE